MQYDEKTVLMGIGFRRQSEFLNSRVILWYDRWQLGGILHTAVEGKSSMLQVALVIKKIHMPTQEMWVQSLGWEDRLE